MSQKRMIFHVPGPLDPDGRPTASQIRPFRMLNAFRKIGYQVEVVAGTARERETSLQKIARNLKSGAVYEFCYVESSTMPTLLTEPNHLPRFVDYRLWLRLRLAGVPIGIFYRDVYWRFPEYQNSIGGLKAAVARVFYRLDLMIFIAVMKRVFLPSLMMKPLLWDSLQKKCSDLPPGTDVLSSPRRVYSGGFLRILYVGGLGVHYGFRAALESCLALSFVEVDLCCRVEEWGRSGLTDLAAKYPERLKIHHLSGRDLGDLYRSADLCLLAFEPSEYRRFAIPFKLFEYVSFNRPILAVAGTAASEFVREECLGWVVDDSGQELVTLLQRFRSNPEILRSIADFDVKIVAHSWASRADKVARELCVV